MDMEVKTSSIGTAIQICPAQDCGATMARPDIDLKVKASFLLNLKCPSIFRDLVKCIVMLLVAFFFLKDFKKIFIDVLFIFSLGSQCLWPVFMFFYLQYLSFLFSHPDLGGDPSVGFMFQAIASQISTFSQKFGFGLSLGSRGKAQTVQFIFKIGLC